MKKSNKKENEQKVSPNFVKAAFKEALNKVPELMQAVKADVEAQKLEIGACISIIDQVIEQKIPVTKGNPELLTSLKESLQKRLDRL